MKEDNRVQAARQLEKILAERGYPAEFGRLIAAELQTEKQIRRMTEYLLQVKDQRIEDIVDEMLAIKSDIESWQRKKIAEYNNRKINEYMNRADDDSQ